MASRPDELPEGTDHIINGAMETGTPASDGTGASTGSSDPFASTGASTGGSSGASDPFASTGGGSGLGSDFGDSDLGGGASSGFIGSGDALFDDTGGTSTVSTGGAQGAMGQLKGGAQSLKQQATDRVRTLADDGKSRASEALDEFSRVVEEAAGSIDERLGSEYGVYARRAADAVSGFATQLRDTDVDELYDGARNFVRKSPVIAIGTAAAVGFALVRLVKAGIATGEAEPESEIEFEPDAGLTGTGPGSASGSTTGFGA